MDGSWYIYGVRDILANGIGFVSFRPGELASEG